MRILAFTLGYWHNESLSNYASAHPSLRLPAWVERMKTLFSPIDLFVASGTWSNPDYNPVPQVKVINAGCPYGVYSRANHYGKAAFSAAFAYALNRDDWDLLVTMDTDALFGNVDLDKLLKEFVSRPELMLAPGWLGHPGGPLVVWKRQGAVRACHCRSSENLRDADQGEHPMIWEIELEHIFRNGMWWNPWPNVWTCMNDGTPGRLDWPMISRVPADFVEQYQSTQSIKTKPYVH